MIYNATLLRLDPPEPELPGPDVAVRCAVASPSARQARARRVGEAPNVVAVLYVRARDVPEPGPVAGGFARVRGDEDEEPARHPIVQVVERPGRTLRHVQVYLGAPTE